MHDIFLVSEHPCDGIDDYLDLLKVAIYATNYLDLWACKDVLLTNVRDSTPNYPKLLELFKSLP